MKLKYLRPLSIATKKRLPWLLTAYIVIVIVGLSSWATSTHAQEETTWVRRFFLSEPLANYQGDRPQMGFPVLEADEWGTVHAVWPAVINEQPGVIGDTFFYARWDDEGWSTPIDIFHVNGGIIASPQIVADTKGWLHMVWTVNNIGPAWYSRAPVSEAGSGLAWTSPIQLTDGDITGFLLATDNNDNLHIVYCAVNSDEGVYHISAPTDGAIWTDDVRIWGSSELDFSTCQSRLAIDARDRLHVLFGRGGLEADTLYYSRSDSAGQDWITPVEIDFQDERYVETYGPTYAEVATVGTDEVHIVWLGSPQGQRWHQWSADGGDTWSRPRQMDPNLRGITDPPDLVADSTGTLHMITQGLKNTGPFYATWREGRWTPFVLIDELGDGENEQRADFALVNGNILHAAWDSKPLTEIWTASVKLDAPAEAPKSQPTPPSKATTQREIAPTVVVTATASAGQAITRTVVDAGAIQAAPFVSAESPWQEVIIASIVPVIAVLGLIVFVQWTRGRR